MAHVRQQLRTQAKTELDAIVAFTGVYKTRLFNFRTVDLPACNVYTPDEISEPIVMGGRGARTLKRTQLMVVEIYDFSVAGLDDQLDVLSTAVEGILGNSTLNDLATDLFLAASTFELDSNGEKPVGVLTLTWSVEYRTTEGDPEVAL